MSLTIRNPSIQRGRKEEYCAETIGTTSFVDALGLILAVQIPIAFVFFFVLWGISETTWYKTGYICSAITVLIIEIVIIMANYYSVRGLKNTYQIDYHDSNTPMHHQFFHLISKFRDIVKDCNELKDLSTSSFLHSSIDTVKQVSAEYEWEIYSYWHKARPFYDKGTVSTKDSIQNKYNQYKSLYDQCRSAIAELTDVTFKYLAWANPEDHLTIVKRDIDLMVQSLEEANKASLHADFNS